MRIVKRKQRYSKKGLRADQIRRLDRLHTGYRVYEGKRHIGGFATKREALAYKRSFKKRR